MLVAGLAKRVIDSELNHPDIPNKRPTRSIKSGTDWSKCIFC